MRSVHDLFNRLRRVAAPAWLLLAAFANGSCSAAEPAHGRARAEWLASGYARHVGAANRTLDGDGDLALGETGLRWDPAQDALVGRVFMQKAMLAGAPPAEKANLRRMVGVLNDPRVGGMYDRGGGEFVLDEPRDGYFLVRSFRVATTSRRQLAEGMERMAAVTGAWTVQWFSDVAMVMHGHQAPPTRPVTLADRPR